MKRKYFTYEERQHILHYVEEQKAKPGKTLCLSELLCSATTPKPPPCEATYYQWKCDLFTKEQYTSNLSRRGRQPKLSDGQMMLLLGFSCHCRRLHRQVKQQTLIDFASTHLHTQLTPPWLTYHMKEHGFSSQQVLTRASRLTTQKVVDDALAFIKELRSYHYAPDCIISMDETGLWSNVSQPRTYHFRGEYVSPPFFHFDGFSDFEILSSFLSRCLSSCNSFHQNPYCSHVEGEILLSSILEIDIAIVQL